MRPLARSLVALCIALRPLPLYRIRAFKFKTLQKVISQFTYGARSSDSNCMSTVVNRRPHSLQTKSECSVHETPHADNLTDLNIFTTTRLGTGKPIAVIRVRTIRSNYRRITWSLYSSGI